MESVLSCSLYILLKSGDTALDIAMKIDPESKVAKLLKEKMMQVLQILIFNLSTNSVLYYRMQIGLNFTLLVGMVTLKL